MKTSLLLIVSALVVASALAAELPSSPVSQPPAQPSKPTTEIPAQSAKPAAPVVAQSSPPVVTQPPTVAAQSAQPAAPTPVAPQPSAPVGPQPPAATPEAPVSDPATSSVSSKVPESLIDESKTQAPALPPLPTEQAGKIAASQDIPTNPAPIIGNSTAPGNSTSTPTSKALAGMSAGTVSLIVISVLAVIVLTVGLLQYLLKSRRMSSRS